MNIKKSLSAIMSMSMLLTSAAYVPLGNVYAEDAGYYDQSADYYAEANGDYEEVLVGTMNFRAPKKVIYRVGEEFDVTGGYCSGQRIDPIVSETGIISAESILLMNSIFQVLIILKRLYMRYFLLLQRTKAERMRYNIQDLK